MSDPQLPDGPPEQLNMRGELRRRLHTVDALTPPPAPDFAARAIAAARAAEAELDESPEPLERFESRESVGSAPSDEVASARAPEHLVTPAPAATGSSATTATGATAAAGSSDAASDAQRTAAVVPLHQRRWARVAVGAAAAVLIGAVAVPTLPRLLGGTSASTSGSAAGAAADSAATGGAGSVPDAEASGPRVVDKGTAATSAESAQLSTGVATGPTGSSSDLTRVVEALRVRLTGPPYDVTSVVLRADPTRVEVTVRTPDAAVLDVARGALPAGTQVVILRAP